MPFARHRANIKNGLAIYNLNSDKVLISCDLSEIEMLEALQHDGTRSGDRAIICDVDGIAAVLMDHWRAEFDRSPDIGRDVVIIGRAVMHHRHQPVADLPG